MTTKDYLAQAYRLDQRINSKIEQVTSLHGLAVKATSTISDKKVSSSSSVHRMEDIIVKMIDMENEINSDIDRLIELKRAIMSAIKSVYDTEAQTVLELRYLCFKTWEQIAVEMGYTIHHLYKLHSKGVSICERILKT